MSGIGLIVLAAGASTRMGCPKQLLRYQGHSLIQHIVKTVVDSVCNPIIVVLGANAEQIKSELQALPVRVVENPDWATGMSTSIRVGIEVLHTEHPDIAGVVFAVCDQPLTSTRLINQLVENYQTSNAFIVASDYAGILGVPALFHPTLFPELSALQGDVGARSIIQRHLKTTLGILNPEGVLDIDTPTDYQTLLEREEGK